MNFLIPAGLPNGDAPVVISSGDGTKTIVIADVSPALFSANTDGKGVVAGNLLRVTTGGRGSTRLWRNSILYRRLMFRRISTWGVTNSICFVAVWNWHP